MRSYKTIPERVQCRCGRRRWRAYARNHRDLREWSWSPGATSRRAPETESRVRADGHRCWRKQVERGALLSLQLLRLDPLPRPPPAHPLEFALRATDTTSTSAAGPVVPT